MPSFSKQDFSDLLQNSLPLSTQILFGLRLDLSFFFFFFFKALLIVIQFLSFKGKTHEYLLKI